MTDETKHTQGPWFANKSSADFCNVCVGSGEYDPAVAAVHPNSFSDIFGAETEANARLIAAAPEMLDALKAAWAKRPDNWDNEWDQVESAIAKAEGRSK